MPSRHFEDQELIVASHNLGKVREIRDLLKDFVPSVLSAGDLDLPEPEETEDTFIGNAALKALAAAKAANRVALSDDSGLCVSALNGDPGLFSARWGGPTKDFDIAMDLVLNKLSTLETQDRSAYFVCALALAWPDGHVEAFEGRVYGVITTEKRGTLGFGYDPIFIADGYDITFGEMDPDHKHAISHRADAFKQLVHACFKS